MLNKQKNKKGYYIIFDGVDGCGKSTQIKLLEIYLNRSKVKFVSTREPGGTLFGKTLRKILLFENTSPWEQLMLFEADRARNFSEIIKPALQEGRTVISVRGFPSTLVYQLYANSVGNRTLVEEINDASTMGIKPDLVVILDMNPKIVYERLKRSGKKMNKMEKSLAFQKKIREGFLKESKKNENWEVLDANFPVGDVHANIISLLKKKNILN